MRAPLEGVRVVELASMVAGPFCGKMLADVGAQVVKVEARGVGDEARRAGPFPDGHTDLESSLLFCYLNTNKLGVTLDTGQPRGR